MIVSQFPSRWVCILARTGYKLQTFGRRRMTTYPNGDTRSLSSLLVWILVWFYHQFFQFSVWIKLQWFYQYHTQVYKSSWHLTGSMPSPVEPMLALIFAWSNFGIKYSYFSYILKITPSYIVLAIIRSYERFWSLKLKFWNKRYKKFPQQPIFKKMT